MSEQEIGLSPHGVCPCDCAISIDASYLASLCSAHLLLLIPNRKELIAQYSRLSEDAARRERKAMWRVQRMRLDEQRAHFLQQDHQSIQVPVKLSQLHTSPSKATIELT